jgi:hypothetical protein
LLTWLSRWTRSARLHRRVADGCFAGRELKPPPTAPAHLGFRPEHQPARGTDPLMLFRGPASLHRHLLCNAASGDAVAPAVNPSFSAGRTTSLTLAFRSGSQLGVDPRSCSRGRRRLAGCARRTVPRPLGGGIPASLPEWWEGGADASPRRAGKASSSWERVEPSGDAPRPRRRVAPCMHGSRSPDLCGVALTEAAGRSPDRREPGRAGKPSRAAGA